MIEVKISAEALTDILTPEALVPHECVVGLPKNVILQEVIFNKETNIVKMLFDDGNSEITESNIVYESTIG